MTFASFSSMGRQSAWAVFLICVGYVTPDVFGCPYSIRDSAFIVGGNTPSFDLYVIVSADMADREKFEGWVNTAGDVWLTDTPVKARLVTANDTATHNLRETMGEKSPDLTDLPSAVLVGPEGETFVFACRRSRHRLWYPRHAAARSRSRGPAPGRRPPTGSCRSRRGCRTRAGSWNRSGVPPCQLRSLLISGRPMPV